MTERQKVVLDMFHMSEDQRIDLIGATAMERGRVEFMVDGDKLEKGKADRYVHKLAAKYPRLREIERKKNDPVPNVTTVTVGIRADA